MAALSGNRNTKWKGSVGARRGPFPLAAGATIYLGSIVALDGSGNANPGSTAVGRICVGVAQQAYFPGVGGAPAGSPTGGPGFYGNYANNAAGAAGAVEIFTRSGIYGFDASGSITMANAGQIAFMVDDHTVALGDGGVTTAVAQAGIVTPASGSPQILALAHKPIVAGSVLVQNNAKSTTYIEGTDYAVDYPGGMIFLLSTAIIGAGGVTLQVGYSYTSAPTRSAAGVIVDVDPVDGSVWVDFSKPFTLAV
jgi:hypothetical protein